MVKFEIITARGRIFKAAVNVDIHNCEKYNLRIRERIKRDAIKEVLENIYTTLDNRPRDEYFETFVTLPSKMNNYENDDDDTIE